MRVIAKELGQTHDGQWHQPGEEFEVSDAEVSTRWMRRADGEPWPVRERVAKPVVKADDSLRERIAALEARVAALEADDDKPRRGRPRKDATDETTS